MQLILLRHGDRSPGFNDVSLSDKGHQQALALSNDLKLTQQPNPSIDRILCSPKRRAQETVGPLSKALNVHVEIWPLLDQMKNIETPRDFFQRVQFVLDQLPTLNASNILICSHSDWLQHIVLMMANETQNFAPYAFFSCAEYKVFLLQNNQWIFQK